MRVAAYVRVSTREQQANGLSLAGQKASLSAAAAQREGWTLAYVAVETASGANLKRRPVLTSLLDDLDAGRYNVLLCARLDRLARSVGDFAGMLDRAKRHGWQIVMLDPAVDMTTPYGEAMAGVAAVFAQLERALISQRTIEGLEQARAEGRVLGMPTFSDRAVIDRMARLRDGGATFDAIADQLNAEGVPTVRGRSWYASTVRRVLLREEGNTQ